ncbi:hypothetical protein M8C21_007817 [Ambrosia artemisiifolia]|uniref:Uncharacterized protein n=1 Tax=Ambrosia artemisiifolia TaxID=4212 RepID=A0AAD5D2N6_AMBAR|nr:hypothetical protein M8C21_007817 [Ambrosia artemisiifolia]
MLLLEPPCGRSNHLAAMIVKQTKFDGMMNLLQQHLPTGFKEWLGNEDYLIAVVNLDESIKNHIADVNVT